MSRRQFLLAVFTIMHFERAKPVHHGSFIDIDDILNENFMPSALFSIEIDTPRTNMFVKDSNISRSEFFNITTKKDFSSAFSTMKFHRKMMNEYQATSFLAKQVMEDFIKPKKPTIEKRMGQSNGRDEAMLLDQGSTSYKNWLEKTTTLEDVQSHFRNKTGRKRNHNFKRRQGFDYSEYDYYEDDDEQLDFSEGDISGFAIQNTDDSRSLSEASDKVFFSVPSVAHDPIYPIPSLPLPTAPAPASKSGHGWSHPPSGHNQGWSQTPSGHNQGWSQPPSGHNQGWSPPPSSHESWDDGEHFEVHDYSDKKELGFKEIVDVALTTLAFLSFGMFFLQVILCITMNKDDGSTMMMMPMEGNGTVEVVEEIRRRKRGIFNSLANINELSRRAIISSEATLNITADGGKCHLKVLCDNNLYAKEKSDGQQIWMPVWSLGLSYMSSRFKMENTSTNILESLKAVILGIGGGDCSVYGC